MESWVPRTKGGPVGDIDIHPLQEGGRNNYQMRIKRRRQKDKDRKTKGQMQNDEKRTKTGREKDKNRMTSTGQRQEHKRTTTG